MLQTTRLRTAEEVLDDHLEKRLQGRFEDDLAQNYAPDVVMFSAAGVFRGHDGVRELHRRLVRELPDCRFEYRVRLLDGDVGFLEWSAACEHARVDDGADSFVIHDGKIVAQTIHYTVEPSGAPAPPPG